MVKETEGRYDGGWSAGESQTNDRAHSKNRGSRSHFPPWAGTQSLVRGWLMLLVLLYLLGVLGCRSMGTRESESVDGQASVGVVYICPVVFTLHRLGG